MTLLAGLDVPSTGNIQLLSNPISQMSDEDRASIRSEHLGFVFQSFLLIPSLSALGNVTLPCLLKGEQEDEAKARQLLESVGLGHRIDHLPSQLSGGEQQRVAIARAFMTSLRYSLQTNQRVTWIRIRHTKLSSYCLISTSSMAQRSCSSLTTYR